MATDLREIRPWQRACVTACQVGAVVLVIVLWQVLADHHTISTFIYSDPRAVYLVLRGWVRDGSLGTNVTATCIVLVLGYAIGMLVGVALGIVMGTTRVIGQVIEPFIVFFNAVPRLVLLPLLIVWFGFGYPPQVMLVAAVLVFLVALNIATGLRHAPSAQLNHARVLGASRAQLVRYVYLPSITVWLLSTARVTVGYAFQAAIAAEFIGSARGLGSEVVFGQDTFQVSVIYAALAVMVVISVIFDLGLHYVEKRATSWMP
jgi:NitT/TauT family transport system permease protein